MLPALGVVFAIFVIWFFRRRRVRVPCELDLERTHDFVYAHLDLEGLLVEPGDQVLIEDAPDHLEYGEKKTLRRNAVVERASWPRRAWTRLVGTLNLYELYDVGFE